MTEEIMPEKTVLLITNIPTPYRIPLFNKIHEILAEKKVTFTVVFGGSTYPRRKWKVDLKSCAFPYRVLKSRTLRLGNVEKTMFLYSGLGRQITEIQPELIVSIGFSLATLKAMFLSRKNGRKIVIWSGSVINRKCSALKRFYRRAIARRAAGFIAYGSKASEYLESLGVNPGKTMISLNTTDTEYFHRKVQAARRLSGGHPGDGKLLYVGYLSRRKNVGKLLAVLLELRKMRQDFHLEVVGDGDDRLQLERFVEARGMKDYVHFHGNQPMEVIPKYLASCDCFLFQTDFDIWGLVLNEAMAAGIPCIASIHAGATHDLIEDGVNGFSMDFADSSAVARRIDWILRNPLESKHIGSLAAERIAEKATIERSASDFAAAIMAHISNS